MYLQVLKGDILRLVDGVPIAGKTLNEAQDLLVGAVGTFVQLDLGRPKLKSTYQVRLTKLNRAPIISTRSKRAPII